MVKIKKISYGIVIIRKYKEDYLFLLLRAYKNFDFPKGGAISGELPLEAALRETEEETTLTPNDLKFPWGKLTKESDPYKKGKKIAVYFLAETEREDIDLPINPKIGKPEHHEFGWFTYREASKLINGRIKKVLDWANEIITR